MEDTFKGSVTGEEQHDTEIKRETIEPPKNSDENYLPRSTMMLKKFYDLQDKFKRVTNYKTHSLVVQYNVINLGTLDKPQNINLRVQCSNDQKVVFTKLFKEYKDVFAWSYEDFKTFDTYIMQHVILIKKGAKPMQKKLCKMHPSLAPMVKAELNKLISAQIIFHV